MQTEEFLQKPVWLISLFFLPMHILTQNTSVLLHARVQGFLFFSLSGMQTSLGDYGGTDKTGQESAHSSTAV